MNQIAKNTKQLIYEFTTEVDVINRPTEIQIETAKLHILKSIINCINDNKKIGGVIFTDIRIECYFNYKNHPKIKKFRKQYLLNQLCFEEMKITSFIYRFTDLDIHMNLYCKIQFNEEDKLAQIAKKKIKEIRRLQDTRKTVILISWYRANNDSILRDTIFDIMKYIIFKM